MRLDLGKIIIIVGWSSRRTRLRKQTRAWIFKTNIMGRSAEQVVKWMISLLGLPTTLNAHALLYMLAQIFQIWNLDIDHALMWNCDVWKIPRKMEYLVKILSWFILGLKNGIFGVLQWDIGPISHFLSINPIFTISYCKETLFPAK